MAELEFKPDVPKINRVLEDLGYFERPVRGACVVDMEDKNGDRFLCAYIVPGKTGTVENVPGVKELRDYLSRMLPDYMIPLYIVPLERLPLTPNGKVDRGALPSPVIKSGNAYAAPRTLVEERLLEIWQNVLTLDEPVGIDDNFFELGGYSLKAMELGSKIHCAFDVKVPLTEIFKNQTVRKLAAFIQNSAAEKYISIEPVEVKEYYVLSSPQRRLYVLQQMDRQGIVYNLPSVWEVEGVIDAETLARIFRDLIRRHESLRTSFHLVNEEPVQRIHDTVEFQVENYKIQNTNNQQMGTPSGIIKSFIRPFDLSKAPLLRVGSIDTGQDRHLLMADMHHIISDGLSTYALVNEFMALFSGKGPLPPPRLQYKDYSEWRNSQKKKEIKLIKKQEQYWTRTFYDNAPPLDLPLDYPRGAFRSGEGSVIISRVGNTQVEKLKDFAREKQVTLFMLLLAVYTVLLSKYTNREDIVVGTPAAGRKHADLENIIGLFVNMLPLRNFPGGDKTFAAFLEKVKTNAIEAHENQDYPYEELVSKLGLQGDSSRNPLFDTVFQLLEIKPIRILVPGKDHPVLILTPYETGTRVSHFDLYLVAVEDENTIRLRMEYSTALFRQETIEKMLEHYKEILEQVMENSDIPLKDIRLTQRLTAIKPGSLQEYREDF